MANPFNDMGEINMDALLEAASGRGAIYDSPATAQDTLLRGQEQHRDLALNFMRQMLDLQGGGQERLLGAQGEQARQTIDAKAQYDPVGQVTAGVGRGESLEGGTLSDLMQIIFGKQGVGNTMARMAGIEAQGQRQSNQHRTQLIMQASNQIAKLEEPDEGDEQGVARYKKQVLAIQRRLQENLSSLGGGAAGGGGDRRSRLQAILGGQGQQAMDPMQQFYEQHGLGQPAFNQETNDAVARLLGRYPLDLEAPQE